ncbi:hypothetical protein Tco_0001008 [Tanacetum coccineum]
MKRISRYLKGQPKLGLWYPRDSPFNLEAFSNSDYARASLGRKSTTGGCQFRGKRLISWKCKKQTVVANSTTEAEYVLLLIVVDMCYGFKIKCLIMDETVYKEWEDIMERAATTASSLEAEQDSGNINRTQSMATLNEPLPQGTGSGSGPRVHTPRSDEGSMTLHELTVLCTNLPNKVESLETELKQTKQTYSAAFTKFIKKGRYGQNLDTQEGFGAGLKVTTVDAELNTASTFVSTASPQIHADTTADDLTLAETLMEIKKSVVKAKGKAKMDETKSLRKMKQRDEEDLPMKLIELVNQRKKFFAQQRAEAKRNKPMTPAQ